MLYFRMTVKTAGCAGEDTAGQSYFFSCTDTGTGRVMVS